MLNAAQRQKIITKVSVSGIITNLVLTLLKLAAGFLSSSVSVINDAINNAADCLSSIVTIIFYSLGKKRPTKKHPLGYGRMEYLSALIVALLVIYTGIECLTSSVESIRNPGKVEVSAFSLIVIILSIAAKIILSRINTKQGRKIDSDALIATGKDALSDVLVTSLTLLSLVLSPFTDLPVDGIAGLFVSLFILWAGFSSIYETASSIMGERPDEERIKQIRSIIDDIMLHSYGPERTLGTCNVEVPIDTHAEDIFDAMTDATRDIYSKTGIYLTFGLYAVNDYRSDVKEMKGKVLSILQATSHHVLSIHAFHVHFDTRTVHFDVVVDFGVKNYDALSRKLSKALNILYPDFTFEFEIDPDYA